MTWQPELWAEAASFDYPEGSKTKQQRIAAMEYGQAVMEADMAEEMHSKPTQAAFILGWLQLGKRVTPMLALQLWGCNRLAARIAELKAEGWEIRREMVEVSSGKRVAEYSL